MDGAILLCEKRFVHIISFFINRIENYFLEFKSFLKFEKYSSMKFYVMQNLCEIINFFFLFSSLSFQVAIMLTIV